MMDPNMTTRTLNNRIAGGSSSLPSWKSLGVIGTLLITLVFVSSMAFAQPITEPFAVPYDATAGIDFAREADADRWAAQGEYFGDIYEASAVASTMRYEAIAADYEARMERSAAASAARYEAAAASLGAGFPAVGANPSMNVAQWYAAPAIASGADNSAYAENPELMIASNWSPATVAASDDSFYAQNPEVLSAFNWSANGGSDLTCAVC